MCKGRGEDQEEEGENGKFTTLAIRGEVFCELCDSEASIYCQADEAFLCRKCDGWVHGANFLARRHIRCLLCGVCRSLTQRYLIGNAVEVVLPTIVSLPAAAAEGRSNRIIVSQKISDDQSLSTSTTTLKKPFLFL